MPILKWFPSQGAPRTFVLYKPVSTIGRALGNDVAIPSHGISETHAQVLFDGRDFNLEEVDKQGEILINGKKKRRARLVDGDRLTLGDAELKFTIFDEPQRAPAFHDQAAGPPPGETSPRAPAQTASDLEPIAGVRKLYEFSEKL